MKHTTGRSSTQRKAKQHLPKDSGDAGEDYIVRRVKCPSCESALMKLPRAFPMYDIQCTRCLFRAQVKSANCFPKGEVFGGGLDIMEKNLRVGQMIPPLIANFYWGSGRTKGRKVYLFPFLTQRNLPPRTRSSGGARPGYREFNYVHLLDDGTPKMVLRELGKVRDPRPSPVGVLRTESLKYRV